MRRSKCLGCVCLEAIRNTSYRGGGVIVCFLQLRLCFVRVTAAGFGDSVQRREVAL